MYISELPFASVSKRVLVHDLSFTCTFIVLQIKLISIAMVVRPGLVLKQRQKATRKWPIIVAVLGSVQSALLALCHTL